ncbi:MAG TPA: acylneuraminate cytidylyltransferase family protein [Gaiellaceae bacterium]|nr:acylneuraminate cytidylyltransferase family protein [Gaiellaceae bacterium]
MSPNLVALVPARAGSERVPGKNVRPLCGHPLLAYSIAAAQRSGVADRVVCSTDSEAVAEIARWYGAEVPFLRPAEHATATSPDFDWIADTLKRLDERYDLFAIVRPTSPFRRPETIRRARDVLVGVPDADSIRAVEPVRQHPGKMWLVEGERMRPLLDQAHLDTPWHDTQFKALPKIYVQTSALEVAWTRVVESGTIGGTVRLPLFMEDDEGFSIDYPEDWERAEQLVRSGVELPRIEVDPWS